MKTHLSKSVATIGKGRRDTKLCQGFQSNLIIKKKKPKETPNVIGQNANTSM